ncbi:hypothetical protein BgiBS90_024657 [Biomphalaria glabrata]|nr:hypothetical protein BgiBS90_024657 [Biomphalaria glabrata]
MCEGSINFNYYLSKRQNANFISPTFPLPNKRKSDTPFIFISASEAEGAEVEDTEAEGTEVEDTEAEGTEVEGTEAEGTEVEGRADYGKNGT